ncbi:MAG: hypothetical protein ACT4N2_10260 [Hyphomicrobium sp.]
MRQCNLVKAAVAVIGFVIAVVSPAEAWSRKPAGYGEVQTVRHYGYYPRYNHVYKVHYRTDPYAYRWEQPRYYPYYNSGYWRPAYEVRRRQYYALPPYYQAWGYPNRHYQPRRGFFRH